MFRQRQTTWWKVQEGTAPTFSNRPNVGRMNADLLRIQQNLTQFIVLGFFTEGVKFFCWRKLDRW
jgi:hypothetical protein